MSNYQQKPDSPSIPSARKYTPKPKEWFIERIGKRIYRDANRNCCALCDKVAEEGLIVHDEMHARYLADIDHDFATEGIFSNYRDEL